VRNHRLIAGVLGGGAVLLAAGLSLAQTPIFDVKPGLWEITSTGGMSGMPPIPPEALANMTPEKRAQVQAAMQAAQGRGGAPRVIQNCVTEDQLKRGLDFDQHRDPSCQRTVSSNAPNLLVIHEECTGQNRRVGDFRFEALDRETMKGSINMVMTMGANTMTMNQSVRGRWLGTDCGTVAPRD
jgi:hypothetical protein